MEPDIKAISYITKNTLRLVYKFRPVNAVQTTVRASRCVGHRAWLTGRVKMLLWFYLIAATEGYIVAILTEDRNEDLKNASQKGYRLSQIPDKCHISELPQLQKYYPFKTQWLLYVPPV
jgi:hypothetical protein